MRFSFSAFVFHVIVLGTTTFPESIGSTTTRKTAKNHQHATAPPTPTPPVSYLVAQPGIDCSIKAKPALSLIPSPRVDTGEHGELVFGAPIPIENDDKRYYTLRATVSTETIAFAERPTRTALTVSTHDFVDGFKELFETSNPNGALTFFSKEEGLSSSAAAASLDGPLIAVLSEPKIVGTNVDSTLDVEYNITQSESQRAVGSIETFMDNTFRSCSIFIDAYRLALNLRAIE